ncbi:MAG: CoA transferase [Arenimonas sp.]|jgi:crotonobetainyl-CoA:carnitine CoA-transferase CaiB-like acyl-CoA transferase|uniref:CaiB/BaiF CoA transferase family protein n=1 Tax=Arenimonas sp. TaxID=1872635 RepID=UPI001B6676C8|nr:CoA transferase [Arenimonas sp.]
MTALSGVKVLDLSRVLAGPWCGQMLADLGADVIKVESFEGDDTRGMGPPYIGAISAYFSCANRNKRSICIDLHKPESREIIQALVEQADVFIENFRTGTAERLGVGYEAMRAINPRLIYCSISGYGRTGPDAQRAGYDYAVQAEGGLMAITGARDGAPNKAAVAVVDLATGQNAVIAILAALQQRHGTGHGQHVSVSLFDTQLTWLANIGAGVLFTGKDAPRYGNEHASIVPYQDFSASDQHFVLTVANEKLWHALCDAVGHPEWIHDPRFDSNSQRVLHRDLVTANLQAIFSAHPVAYWLQAFSNRGIPCAPINSVKQALHSPLAKANGNVLEVDGIPMVASPLKLSESPVSYHQAPPQLGEHSQAILTEIGLDYGYYAAQGVVK